MKRLDQLLENNRRWAAEMSARDPLFFERLAKAQSPDVLWIGCSDSRVPANQIVGLLPGEVFVHRNVANVVPHTDVNCLSVLQYAVEVLRVRHVIVCGHYGCGGVRAALQSEPLGLIDNWLREIRDVHAAHQLELDALPELEARCDRLCELNVTASVARVCQTTIVQGAWRAGRELTVHGWIYALSDGRVRDLGASVEGPNQIGAAYRYGAPRPVP